jgi:hypothetical protein
MAVKHYLTTGPEFAFEKRVSSASQNAFASLLQQVM